MIELYKQKNLEIIGDVVLIDGIEMNLKEYVSVKMDDGFEFIRVDELQEGDFVV
jgi:hypothetical protein